MKKEQKNSICKELTIIRSIVDRLERKAGQTSTQTDLHAMHEQIITAMNPLINILTTMDASLVEMCNAERQDVRQETQATIFSQFFAAAFQHLREAKEHTYQKSHASASNKSMAIAVEGSLCMASTALSNAIHALTEDHTDLEYKSEAAIPSPAKRIYAPSGINLA